MLPNTNKVEVEARYGELTSLIQWCERNCTDEWAYQVLDLAGEKWGDYEFYFKSEKDLVAFTIWKT